MYVDNLDLVMLSPAIYMNPHNLHYIKAICFMTWNSSPQSDGSDHIFSNIIQTIFKVVDGQQFRYGLELPAEQICGQGLSFGKMIEVLYVP